MKIEIMVSGDFKDLMSECMEFNVKRLYKCPDGANNSHSHYEIWEIEKSDARKIEEICMLNGVLFCYSKGANKGTPFEPLTINGQFVIGWTAVGNKNTFNCLTDYFTDGLGIADPYEICACATTMAKTNGWSLSDMWRKLEG